MQFSYATNSYCSKNKGGGGGGERSHDLSLANPFALLTKLPGQVGQTVLELSLSRHSVGEPMDQQSNGRGFDSNRGQVICNL